MTREDQIREVMRDLKLKAKGDEVHHIFGRVGRLAACQFFCVFLPRPRGGANHHDLPPSVLSLLRDRNRKDYLEFQEANFQNRDHTTCWWKACCLFSVCILADREGGSDG